MIKAEVGKTGRQLEMKIIKSDDSNDVGMLSFRS